MGAPRVRGIEEASAARGRRRLRVRAVRFGCRRRSGPSCRRRGRTAPRRARWRRRGHPGSRPAGRSALPAVDSEAVRQPRRGEPVEDLPRDAEMGNGAGHRLRRPSSDTSPTRPAARWPASVASKAGAPLCEGELQARVDRAVQSFSVPRVDLHAAELLEGVEGGRDAGPNEAADHRHENAPDRQGHAATATGEHRRDHETSARAARSLPAPRAGATTPHECEGEGGQAQCDAGRST